MVLNRYIRSEIVKPMFLGVGLLLVVFTGYTFAVRLAEAEQDMIPLAVVTQLIGYKAIISMEILLPTALYLSIVTALSRMYRDSEIAAMNAMGAGEPQLMRPVLLLAMLTAAVVGAISLYARPWAYRESYRLEAQAQAEFDINKIEPGHFIELQGSKYVLYARGIDRGRGRLKEVFLQSDQGPRTQVIYAREASLPPAEPGEARNFLFLDGYGYLLDRFGSRDMTLKFNQMAVRIPEIKKDKNYRRKAEPTVNLYHSDAPKDIAEFQWRVSTPALTVLLALLAVPLSRGSPRQGRYHSFIIAILVYAGLFNVTSAARTWVEDGRLSPFPGMWWVYLFPLSLFAVLMALPAWQRRKR